MKNFRYFLFIVLFLAFGVSANPPDPLHDLYELQKQHALDQHDLLVQLLNGQGAAQPLLSAAPALSASCLPAPLPSTPRTPHYSTTVKDYYSLATKIGGLSPKIGKLATDPYSLSTSASNSRCKVTMASNSGSKRSPKPVRWYSTLGGTSANTTRSRIFKAIMRRK